jgi:hypothetical protein
LKKGDIGGFKNLQTEGIYGKRYNSILLSHDEVPKQSLGHKCVPKQELGNENWLLEMTSPPPWSFDSDCTTTKPLTLFRVIGDNRF